jgi:hypothetical protein
MMQRWTLIALFACSAWPVAPSPGLADAVIPADQPRLYPNPVYLDDPNPNAHVLRFDQVAPGSEAQVYDIVGQPVITLHLTGDYHQDAWDCVNSNGAVVATGVYIVMITQPSGQRSIQRAAVLRVH